MRIKITRISPFSGRETTIEVNKEGYDKWQEGELIQRALPELSPAEREVLITGLTFEEQKEIFGG